MTNSFQDFSSPSAVFKCHFPTHGNSIGLKRIKERSTLYFKYFASGFPRIYNFEVSSNRLFQTDRFFLLDTRSTNNIALINLKGATWEAQTSCAQLLKQSHSYQSCLSGRVPIFPALFSIDLKCKKMFSLPYLLILHTKRNLCEVCWFFFPDPGRDSSVGWVGAGGSQSMGIPCHGCFPGLLSSCRWGSSRSPANIWDDSNQLNKALHRGLTSPGINSELWMYHVALTHHRCGSRMGILHGAFFTLDILKFIKMSLRY